MNELDTQIPSSVMQYYVDEFIPNWNVVMVGPVPFGQFQPIHLTMSDVILGSAEDAEAHMREHIQALCEQVWNREYVPEDWELVSAQIQHGN